MMTGSEAFKAFTEQDMNIHEPPIYRDGGKKRVSYYYDNDTGNYTYGLGHPMKPHRMRMTHSLVTNYGLFDEMEILHQRLATKHEMTRFHSDEYIEFLSRVTPSTVEELTGSGARFLVGDDCPAFDGVFEFCQISAGGSICAAEKLVEGSSDICVNWAGGLHHAKKREASGFCYVNDIVLAILELLKHHQRVLYIDIDIHHGDGVEEAFYTTDRVLTCSFHKFGEYFPGTGDVRDTGYARGKGYAVNVPLRDGIDDWNFKQLFEPVIQGIMDWYRPGAIVLQCGADSLAGDKLGCFNLSMRGHASCVSFMKKFDVPLLVLGGGGYTIRNVARVWAYETGLLLGKDLDEDLPYNDYFEYFGPEFKLAVPANNMKNHNTPKYLSGIVERIFEQMRNLPFAPSAPLQSLSRSVLSRYGDNDGHSDDEDQDNLDARIIKKMRMARLAAGKEAYDDEPSTSRYMTYTEADRGEGRHVLS